MIDLFKILNVAISHLGAVILPVLLTIHFYVKCPMYSQKSALLRSSLTPMLILENGKFERSQRLNSKPDINITFDSPILSKDVICRIVNFT